jgi:formylglycine-generating enzyme required for sulfatase activity
MGRSEVPSGSDYFTKSEADEIPEHTATVGPFALDKYEVTVGRFREFAAHYDEWHVSGGNPQPNSGRHPLAGHTGWGQSWTMAAGDLPANAEALLAVRSCDQGTWTEVAGTDSTHESYPMNCVTWFEAFAFCIWDGGRLPTEAEWEYVAAGGVLNRLYPWGADAPDNSRLNYWGSDNSPSLVVGSKLTSGAGYFGHADLAGSVSEWVFDWYDERYYGELGGTAKACDNCAFCDDYANPTAYARVHRGGSWSDGTSTTRAACRGIAGPSAHNNEIGFRCARDI